MTKQPKKFEVKMIGVDTEPVMIIGQNPGRQRKGAETGIVWEGNRSGDFISDIIKDHELENVILTNVCNYREMTDEGVEEGFMDICRLGEKYNVKKVICLGMVAWGVMTLEGGAENVEVVSLPHPSYILRFNKDREAYIDRLVKEILS